VSARPRPPAITDVATAAGVSYQTVSRVINDHPNVATETRERVLDAMQRLGYRRNIAARSLKTRRSGVFGVVSSGSHLFGPTRTLLAIEQAARSKGLFVSLATVDLQHKDEVAAAIEHLLDQGVDGIVVVASHDQAAAAVLEARADVPVVVAGRVGPEHSLAVAIDQEAGAKVATQHLLDLGHRDVLHLAGPAPWVDARARAVGFRETMAAAGLAPRTLWADDWSAEVGYLAGRELVDRVRRLRTTLPTAVFAANDLLALGMIHALADARVRVPDDVSVVGYDDGDGSAHFVPPLTTVAQELDELGYRCVELLLAARDGTATSSAVAVSPRLLVRESTAPPRDPARVVLPPVRDAVAVTGPEPVPQHVED
jgi:DNA-binding LacI/PurR family transcriptional regulator